MDGWRDYLWHRLNFAWMYAGFTLAFGLRTEGCRHVPRRGPVLVLSNHESFLDPPLIGLAVRRRLRYLARKTLFKGRLFTAFIRSVGAVPVDQEGVAKEGLRACIDLLGAGQALVVFPEGERTPTGEMQPFKPGIQLLLRKAPVPIVPVGLAGAFEALPKHAVVPRLAPLFWPATGSSLAVSVGKPIPPERYQAVPRDELLDYLFREVQAQARRAEKMCRPTTPRRAASGAAPA
jgi:1-acyl-sn-glycerol-3-phosphate acyltransferase